jgi:hypothetical protein
MVAKRPAAAKASTAKRAVRNVAAAQRGVSKQKAAAQDAGIDVDAQRSVFEDQLKELEHLSENPDLMDAGVYNGLLKMALDLLPVAERTYRAVRSDRAMQPVDKLVVQIRELINELKKQRELQNQHVKIIDIAQATLKTALESFVDSMYVAKANIKSDLSRAEYAKAQRHLDSFVQNYAATVRELTVILENDIKGYFTPIPAAPQRGRRK